MSLLLTTVAIKKAGKAAFFAGAAFGIANFAVLTALPVAFAFGAGLATKRSGGMSGTPPGDQSS